MNSVDPVGMLGSGGRAGGATHEQCCDPAQSIRTHERERSRARQPNISHTAHMVASAKLRSPSPDANTSWTWASSTLAEGHARPWLLTELHGPSSEHEGAARKARAGSDGDTTNSDWPRPDLGWALLTLAQSEMTHVELRRAVNDLIATVHTHANTATERQLASGTVATTAAASQLAMSGTAATPAAASQLAMSGTAATPAAASQLAMSGTAATTAAASQLAMSGTAAPNTAEPAGARMPGTRTVPRILSADQASTTASRLSSTESTDAATDLVLKAAEPAGAKMPGTRTVPRILSADQATPMSRFV
jgi:hypothetical protein